MKLMHNIAATAAAAFAVFAFVGTANATPSQCDAAAGNLIQNCGFEAGPVAQANLGFTSQYAYTSNLLPAATFFIGSNPNNFNPNFGTPTASPHSGNFQMIINGDNVANTKVWEQSGISIKPNTNYFFSVFLASVDALSPARLNFSANGVQLGSIFTASSTPGLETEFFATFNSGTNTTVDLAVVDQNTIAGGNDFALDDFIFDTTAPTGGTGVGGTGTTTVPEPSTLLLVGGGLLVLAARRRRTRP
jgi:hypothetical protein